MDTILGLTVDHEYHKKITKDKNNIQFKIWNLDVDIQNAPFASGDQDSRRFKINSSVNLEVPVSFGGKLLPPMHIKVENSAGYTPKF